MFLLLLLADWAISPIRLACESHEHRPRRAGTHWLASIFSQMARWNLVLCGMLPRIDWKGEPRPVCGGQSRRSEIGPFVAIAKGNGACSFGWSNWQNRSFGLDAIQNGTLKHAYAKRHLCYVGEKVDCFDGVTINKQFTAGQKQNVDQVSTLQQHFLRTASAIDVIE